MVLALTTGCVVHGPVYHRPAVPLSSEYREPVSAGPTLADLDWWQLYRDPVLRELISAALTHNLDLEQAVARLEIARATVRFVHADQFPQIGGSFQASRAKVQTAVGPVTGSDYRLGADLSYEADLFGRLSRTTRAARVDLLSTEFARRAVIFSLVSEVAQAYFELRDFDLRLAILRRTLVARQAGLKVIQDRFNLGLGSDVEVLQSRREVEAAAADIPNLERLITQKENQLCELTGRPPTALARGDPLTAQNLPPDVPAGLPVQLLERRPDVRQAELELTAQHLRVDIARALRLPRLAITGFAGLESKELFSLLHEGSFIWSLASNLTAPLFTFGKNQARIDIEKAKEAQLVGAFRAAVLRALREVEDGLVAVKRFQEQLAHLEKREQISREALSLSQLRFESGVTTFLEVLDSQSALLAAELATSETRKNSLVAVVQLYRALGGGWSPRQYRVATEVSVKSTTSTTTTTTAPRPPEAD